MTAWADHTQSMHNKIKNGKTSIDVVASLPPQSLRIGIAAGRKAPPISGPPELDAPLPDKPLSCDAFTARPRQQRYVGPLKRQKARRGRRKRSVLCGDVVSCVSRYIWGDGSAPSF